jgi:outer membrane lipoprotein SlyB
MKIRGSILILSTVSFLFLQGCVLNSTGEKYRSSSYQVSQVNQKQAVQVIDILAILPAQIEVDNSEVQQNRALLGAMLGAAGGAAIGNAVGGRNTLAGGLLGGAAGVAAASTSENTVLVEGVTITFVQHDKTYSSSQVGSSCEFKPGAAVMVSTSATETRIQPNSSCPAD